MFDCCQDNPEKTAASVCGNFYVTGDTGIMDEERYVWFVGRADDIILLGKSVAFRFAHLPVKIQSGRTN